MTVTSYQISAAGASANVDAKGRRSYTVPFDVFVSDAGDGPQMILDYLADQGVRIGASYACGNDVDPLARCNGMSAPNRANRSINQWRVTATYEYPEGKEPETPEGGTSPEPEDWAWQHRFGSVAWQEPCWIAWNQTVFPHPDSSAGSGVPYTRALDTGGPVVNSAGVVLDPTLMRDEYDLVWQVTTFAREYDSRVAEFQGCVNESKVTWHPYLCSTYGIRSLAAADQFDKFQIKCTQAGAVSRVTTVAGKRVPYWEWSFEFRFRWPNWLESVLDRGITARAAAGDPDGIGGQFGDLEDATASAMPVVDGLGRRVPELVLFDGAGWPIVAGAAAEDTGFYFDWLVDYIGNFSYGAPPGGIPFKFFGPP